MKVSYFENMSEKDLFIAYRKTRDIKLRNFLIIKNIPFVKYVIGKIGIKASYAIEKADIFSYGILGLIDAIEKYSHEKNTRFCTYAKLRIQGAIFDEIRKYDWASRSVHEKRRKLEQTIAILEKRLERRVTIADVAKMLNTGIEDVYKLELKIVRMQLLSLESILIGRDDFSLSDDNMKSSISPDDFIEKEGTKQILNNMLNILSKREKNIIIMHYYRNMTFKAIGKVLGVSVGCIYQAHNRIKKKLKTIYVKEMEINV